ncbi:sensor histidine kinase [Paucidesulfovibrio longus]|uniref:sensor histidine kinase n=1 Tax=Paucidesulfovibrio longus TaxID=889 RepID=UPI0003B4A1E0|nr:PAS domain-containing sensor histidine kinase [Paucidesulfovibrio longus]
MTDKSYYSGLRRSMIGTIVVVSLTPLLILAALGGYQFHSAYKQKVLAHMEQLVLGHKQSIDAFLFGKLAEIRVLADVTDFEKVRDDDGLSRLLLSMQERYGGVFVDLGLVNAQGTQVAYSGPFRLGRADYGHALWFQETMQREFYISDVFLGLRGLPHFIVAVKHSWGGQEYILRSTIDFVAFNRLVENIRIGETGLAYIVSRGGEFQTKPRRQVAMSQSFLNEVLSPEQNMGQSRFGGPVPAHVHLGQDPATGEDSVFVTAGLKNGDWILVFQQTQEDAFLLFLRARNFALVGVLLSTLAIGFMAIVLSKRILNTVVETDRQKDMMNEQVIEAGKLASLGELAAGIAHEINNPVAIMVEEAGWIQDLMEEEDLRAMENSQEVLRALGQIRTQGGRCKEITHKLLSFARKIDPTMKTVHINELIEEMAALSEQRARFANVHIVTELAEALPPIEASPSELQQVFLNLINNAIDAMDHEGGQLKVTTRREENQVVISVSDTGQGIPKANLQKIFDPFFTTKAVGKGTGLGLSICYGIIQKMGGEISVSSVLDVGTTFHIRLPLRKGEADDEGRA